MNAIGQARQGLPDKVIEKWQNILDLLAEIFSVPAVLIMKADTENEQMEVFLSSRSEDNPYHFNIIKCSRHASPDTLAKKFYLKGQIKKI